MGKQSRARREKVAEFIERQDREKLKKYEGFYDAWCRVVRDAEMIWSFGHHHQVFEITNVYEYCCYKMPEFFNRKGEALDSNEWKAINERFFIDSRLPFFGLFFYWKGETGINAVTIENGFGAADWSPGEAYYLEVNTFFGGWTSIGIFHTNSCRVFMDADGTNVAFGQIGSQGGMYAYDDSIDNDPYTDMYIARELTVTFAALTIMNCRNVELIEHAPLPEIDRKYETYFGKPITRYKRLRINPIRKVYDYESNKKKPSLGLKAEHLVRGHPVTYTDSAPMFGKWVGTVWHPPHVRGNPNRGRILKDYDVQAPKDDTDLGNK